MELTPQMTTADAMRYAFAPFKDPYFETRLPAWAHTEVCDFVQIGKTRIRRAGRHTLVPTVRSVRTEANFLRRRIEYRIRANEQIYGPFGFPHTLVDNEAPWT